MTAALTSGAELANDSYVLLGLATCYRRNDGETEAVTVLEPIPSAYLETLLQGTPTAYRQVWGATLAEALAIDLAQFSVDTEGGIQRCADYSQRVESTARTYQHRPTAAEHIPVGATRTDFNYSTAQKRILNPKTKVLKSDNVKQHKYTHEVL